MVASKGFIAANQDHLISSLTINSYPFTLSAWVYATGALATNPVAVIVTNQDLDNRFHNIQLRTSFHIAESKDTSSVYATWSSAPPLNTWIYLTGVFASSTARYLYVNGILRATNTNYAGIVAQKMVVGGIQNPVPRQFFEGSIAHPQIWLRSLLAEEIMETMQVPYSSKGLTWAPSTDRSTVVDYSPNKLAIIDNGTDDSFVGPPVYMP